MNDLAIILTGLTVGFGVYLVMLLVVLSVAHISDRRQVAAQSLSQLLISIAAFLASATSLSLALTL